MKAPKTFICLSPRSAIILCVAGIAFLIYLTVEQLRIHQLYSTVCALEQRVELLDSLNRAIYNHKLLVDRTDFVVLQSEVAHITCEMVKKNRGLYRKLILYRNYWSLRDTKIKEEL